MTSIKRLAADGTPDTVRAAIADFRDIVMIAGEDAYAYKGIEEVGGAHVRPSGEGGCIKNPGEKK